MGQIESISARRPRLKIVCAGTGRDGTQSLTHMLRKLFDDAGVAGSVMHEYKSREFFHAYSSFKETGNLKWMAEIRALIDACDHDCIVGNGYSAILPIFAARGGPSLKLILLRRADRDACIASLVRDCRYFPAAYGYYSNDPASAVKRVAAFHFGEMSKEEWTALPLAKKMAWYFDKSHALAASHRGLFRQSMEIQTESLNDESTRRQLADFVLGDHTIMPIPARLNAHVACDWLPDDRRPKLQWLMGRLNLYQVAYDDVYPLEYFVEEFIAWSGYHIRKGPQIGPQDYKSSEEIADSLTRAENTLLKHLEDIRGLRELLAQEPPTSDTEAPSLQPQFSSKASIIRLRR